MMVLQGKEVPRCSRDRYDRSSYFHTHKARLLVSLIPKKRPSGMVVRPDGSFWLDLFFHQLNFARKRLKRD